MDVHEGNENAVWVQPNLVCTVKYMMKTESGSLRQPVFTVLTRSAAEGIAFIHERMPVILPNEAAEDWLNPKYHGDDILQAAITQMKFKICETA